MYEVDPAVLQITRDVVAILVDGYNTEFDCAMFDAGLAALRSTKPPVPPLSELSPGMCEAALDLLVTEGVLEEKPVDTTAPSIKELSDSGVDISSLRSWQFIVK